MELVNWLPDGIFGVYFDFWGSLQTATFWWGGHQIPLPPPRLKKRRKARWHKQRAHHDTHWPPGNHPTWIKVSWPWGIPMSGWYSRLVTGRGQKQRLQSFLSGVCITWRLWAAAWITMESQAHVYPSVVPVHSTPIRMSRWWTCQLCMSLTEMPRL